MKKLLFTSSFLVVLFLGAQPASASVIYRFSGSVSNALPDGGFLQGFEIITPTAVSLPQLFYTADTIPGTCLACDPAPALAAEFYPAAAPGPYDRLGALTGGTEFLYYFPVGAFSTPGIYSTTTGLNTSALQVTDTPEPSTFLLAGFACLGFGLRLRSRGRR